MTLHYNRKSEKANRKKLRIKNEMVINDIDKTLGLIKEYISSKI